MLYFLAYALSAGLVHEAGHVFAANMLGVKVKKIGLCWRGFYVIREQGAAFDNMLISLWGPLMNLVMAFLLQGVQMAVMANLVYAVVNLLPIRNSDGDRALDCWREIWG